MTERTLPAGGISENQKSILAPEQTKTPSPMMIKNRRPGLPERGKIKIGMKGDIRKSKSGTDYQLPVQLDYFIVTTMERGPDGNFVRDDEIHKSLDGEKPKTIPVRLLYDDPSMNFPTRYAAFKGKTLFCSGDGINGEVLKGEGPERKTVPCPCDRLEMGYKGEAKCKINGNLSVIIDGAGEVGGVWKFRTTSFNSVDGISGSLAFIRQVTGGKLAGIPLNLIVSLKVITDVNGKSRNVSVVRLAYDGTPEELQAIGYKLAYQQAEAGIRMGNLLEEARSSLPLPDNGTVFEGENNKDVVEEYYPDQVGKETAKEKEAHTQPETPENGAPHLDAQPPEQAPAEMVEEAAVATPQTIGPFPMDQIPEEVIQAKAGNPLFKALVGFQTAWAALPADPNGLAQAFDEYGAVWAKDAGKEEIKLLTQMKNTLFEAAEKSGFTQVVKKK